MINGVMSRVDDCPALGYCPLVMGVSSRTDAMVTVNSAYAHVDMAAPTSCPLCAAIYA